MAYVEAFVAPVPDANRESYTAHARKMADFFKGHGALRVMECWGTNVPDGEVTSFPLAVKKEAGETVVCGWIEWPDRATRDAAFEKMRTDPPPGGWDMPFDGKRLIFGGFEPIIDL